MDVLYVTLLLGTPFLVFLVPLLKGKPWIAALLWCMSALATALVWPGVLGSHSVGLFIAALTITFALLFSLCLACLKSPEHRWVKTRRREWLILVGASVFVWVILMVWFGLLWFGWVN